ncbi:MAG: preprotein translocase subunit SecG [Candidatus Brocadiia bacterium]
MREFFITLLWIIFVVDALFLVLIVLLQSGRGGGLSGMLGGGGMAESALGPRAGLNKVTGWMAAIFFVSAMLIGLMTRPRGAMEPEEAAEAEETEPAGGVGGEAEKTPEPEGEGTASEKTGEDGGETPPAGETP